MIFYQLNNYANNKPRIINEPYILILKLTTSVLTTTTLKYTFGAGITAGAGTRLFLQLLL